MIYALKLRREKEKTLRYRIRESVPVQLVSQVPERWEKVDRNISVLVARPSEMECKDPYEI